MHDSEMTVRPHLQVIPELLQPLFKYVTAVTFAVVFGVLIDVIQLALAVLSEVESNQVNIFVSMHTRRPESGVT